MHVRTSVVLSSLAFAFVVGLSACEEKQTASATRAAPSARAPESAVPAATFLASAPADAKPVKEAKASAAMNDRVVLRGRIGSGEEPFVKGRAVFTVVDLGVKYCGEVEKDDCKTPWDYCCEPPDVLSASSATIQLVDAAGHPLRTELSGTHGLRPLAVVTVVGKVSQKDGETFIINAENLYVQP